MELLEVYTMQHYHIHANEADVEVVDESFETAHFRSFFHGWDTDRVDQKLRKAQTNALEFKSCLQSFLPSKDNRV